ncbi:hypothetical protein GCM10018954_054640 [Kutzneria kofuensis]
MASVSTIAAREVLTSSADGFIAASASASTRPRVRSLNARWIETMSLPANNSSLDSANRAPTASVRSAVRFWLHASTSMPNARAIVATRVPILPSPSSPSVAPTRSVPMVLCHGPPERNATFSGTTCRHSPRINAQVSSTGGSDRLAVPHTVTPSTAAALRSMAALRIPDVMSSFSRGSRASSEAGNGVRSRMITTTSKSASAAATSSSEDMCSRKTVRSTRLQSALARAASW